MNSKLPKESDLVIRQSVLERLQEVDALLFDIDGVLLDVSKSFRLVACDTVQRFLEEHCHWQPNGPLLLPDDILLFKQAGGFNNDWDLTQAAALYFLKKSQSTGTQDAEELRAASPTLQEFTDGVQRAGGGLKAAEHALMPADSPEQRRELTLQWNQKLIVQLFQERYAGDEYCRDLYGFDPEYTHGAGYLENERVLIDVASLPERIRRYGILTGRTREETEVALERTDMLGRIPRRNVLCAGDGLEKPDPNALLTLARAVRTRVALYVGDTLDDLRMVVEYGKARREQDPQVHSCQVLSGITGKRERQSYLEQGADIIAPDVNALLKVLSAG